VLLQAGNVNTGAFDDFDSIIRWAKSSQGPVWVHIDGAFGLFAGASDEHRHLLKGAEKADSWAVDLHKMLQVPYDSAAVFVKDATTMRDTFTAVAPYAAAAASGGGPGDAGVSQQVELVPELQNSRRGRALVAYATLKHLGKKGVSALVKNLCRRARLFASQLSSESRTEPEIPVEVLNEVFFNQVLVSFGRAEDTLSICEAVRKSGKCWVAATVWKDRTAMRLSVTNWATTDQDIEISAKAIIKCARKVIFE
jgi:glutamate/tyrosine decarboxylase-like PLP-dependent enzyme